MVLGSLTGMQEVFLVSDANVLIDYHKANKKLIRILCSEYRVLVPQVIMDEINEFSQEEAIQFGIEIIDEIIDETFLNLKMKNLSNQDKSCISLSLNFKAKCLTNDKNLKDELEKLGVETFWGLEMILLFTSKKLLKKEEAKKIGKKIFDENKRFKESVHKDFFEKIKNIK